jgi:hypothetical protein
MHIPSLGTSICRLSSPTKCAKLKTRPLCSAKIPRLHATQALCGFLDLRPRQRRGTIFAHSLITAHKRGKRELAFALGLRVDLARCALSGGEPVGICWRDAYMLSRYRLRSRRSEGFVSRASSLRPVLSSYHFVPLRYIAVRCVRSLFCRARMLAIA